MPSPKKSSKAIVQPAPQPEYSDQSFWEKVKGSFQAIGKSTLKLAFTLYFALQDSNTPTSAKATIVAALAYLILPFDVIPDLLPVVSFSDDAALLAAAAKAITSSITPGHKREASRKVKALFG